jgi:hypothetical protein
MDLFHPRRVLNAKRHPTADLTLLDVEPVITQQRLFTDVETDMAMRVGMDIAAWGYPTDEPTQKSLAEDARYFKGHVQGFRFAHHSHTGHVYMAAELSFPAPAGASGGAVFRHDLYPLVLGVITENYESYTGTTHEEIVHERDGEKERVRFRRVTTFALALWLIEFRDWLNDLAPWGLT